MMNCLDINMYNISNNLNNMGPLDFLIKHFRKKKHIKKKSHQSFLRPSRYMDTNNRMSEHQSRHDIKLPLVK